MSIDHKGVHVFIPVHVGASWAPVMMDGICHKTYNVGLLKCIEGQENVAVVIKRRRRYVV